MPRPKTKDALLLASEQNYHKLKTFIQTLSNEIQTSDFPEGTLNRNIRDVLAHLHHWHLLFFSWYDVGMRGEKPAIPEVGYSWKTTPLLNQWIQNHYSEMAIKETEEKLDHSHAKIVKLIQHHSEEELFEKKRFPWTGSTSLGAYLISSTSSHYDWAFKLIKRATK